MVKTHKYKEEDGATYTLSSYVCVVDFWKKPILYFRQSPGTLLLEIRHTTHPDCVKLLNLVEQWCVKNGLKMQLGGNESQISDTPQERKVISKVQFTKEFEIGNNNMIVTRPRALEIAQIILTRQKGEKFMALSRILEDYSLILDRDREPRYTVISGFKCVTCGGMIFKREHIFSRVTCGGNPVVGCLICNSFRHDKMLLSREDIVKVANVNSVIRIIKNSPTEET